MKREQKWNLIFSLLISLKLLGLLNAGEFNEPFNKMNENQIDAFIAQTYRSVPDPRERFVQYSERFIGVPYALYPLGIAPKHGVEDPAIRFDVADCTTMIETLMAMSFAPNLHVATQNMPKIRYRNGKISLRSKNHVAETDWIPNNIGAGYLVDITRDIAGKDTMIVKKTVRVMEYSEDELSKANNLIKTDPPKALEFISNINATNRHFRLKKAALPYVPLADLSKIATRIPSGAIFSVVRENRPDKEILVTHQGLIIQKIDGPFVRHMPFNGKGMDLPFMEYFKDYEKSEWKVLGINLTLVKSGAHS